MNTLIPILQAAGAHAAPQVTTDQLDRFLLTLVIGMLLGSIGQIARAAIGIKKENDKADASTKIAQLIDGRQLAISLLYGAAAGGLAALLMDTNKLALITTDKSVALAIIGAGYAGADFLEGIITKATGEANKLVDNVSAGSTKISGL